MNVDTLPEWILTSVNQAQWTVGKLKCHNCGARLGGFNFVSHFQCPCGRDATVHLNKSRVDHDQKRRVLIVQPRRTRPERVGPGILADLDSGRIPQDSLQLNCGALMSHGGPAEPSLTDGEHAAASFTFSPLYCLSHRRRCSLEDDTDFVSSCFCPVGTADTSAVDSVRSDGPSWSPLPLPASQQLDSDPEGLFDIIPRLAVSGGMSSHLDEQLLQEDVISFAPDVSEEISEAGVFLRRRSATDRVAEQDGVTVPAAPVETSSRLSKKEKNRLKNLRRKQRRRERWLHSQLKQAESVNATLENSDEDDEEEEACEGLTCAVCLDVYFSPYSCHPCGHVFCEPCLRTLAKNRPSNTPCPLCRTFISHTSFHKDLNNTVKSFFPKVYFSRKQNFHNSTCAKWPLPSFRKRFRSFWGYQHRPGGAAGRRRWHFGHGGFTLEALDLADMRGWLFDIGLVIVYIHSLNWILALLLLCLFSYYFFF